MVCTLLMSRSRPGGSASSSPPLLTRITRTIDHRSAFRAREGPLRLARRVVTATFAVRTTVANPSRVLSRSLSGPSGRKSPITVPRWVIGVVREIAFGVGCQGLSRSGAASVPLTAVTTVYTVAEQGGVRVAVIHVRKVGNSSVVTLPPDVLAQANLREGDLVQPTVDRAGRVILEAVTVTPRPTRREIIRNVARRDRAVLRRLAEYDRK